MDVFTQVPKHLLWCNPVYRSLRADNPGIPAKAQISSVLVLGGSVVVVWVIEGDNATGILL